MLKKMLILIIDREKPKVLPASVGNGLVVDVALGFFHGGLINEKIEKRYN